jgi:hypothetical protein
MGLLQYLTEYGREDSLTDSVTFNNHNLVCAMIVNTEQQDAVRFLGKSQPIYRPALFGKQS